MPSILLLLASLLYLGARSIWVRTAIILRRWLTPTYRFGTYDQTIETVSRWRAWSGVALVAAANVQWLGIKRASGRLDPMAWLGDLFTSAVQAALLILVPSVVLVVVARKGDRLAMARGLLVPLKVLVGSVGAIVVAVVVSERSPQLLSSRSSGVVAVLLVVTFVAMGLAAFIAIAAAIVVGLRLIVSHYFRAVDGHPTLRALTALTIAAWAVGSGGYSVVGGHLGGPLPAWANVLLCFVGPLVTASIAFWELRRLQTLFGITIRWVDPAVGATGTEQ